MNSSGLLIKGGNVLDVMSGMYKPQDILCIDGEIAEVSRTASSQAVDTEIDATGKFIIPGLIDSHVHVTAMNADLGYTESQSSSYVALFAAASMRAMLRRGFTTVRDMGGADFGLSLAQENNLIKGPRLFFSGRALSQTGGHGDFRAAGSQEFPRSSACCAGVGRVADGVSAVREAARDELRKGAHHIKVMASGGVASPTDRIDSTQYSLEELRAMVEEATAANRYVAAHAYTARAINRALRVGVRTIEHGNLLDDESISLFLENDAFLVPTLSTYSALKAHGRDFGLSQTNWKKVDQVLEAGLEALARAHSAGVRIAFATDLLGEMQQHQSGEFRIRSEVQDPLSILQSATVVGAQLLSETRLGAIEVQNFADLLVLDADPLADISVLADNAKGVTHVIQSGEIVHHR